jgi:hypothetical protein
MRRPALFTAAVAFLGTVVFSVASPGAGAAGTFEPVKVVLGNLHSCALDSAGRVQCWGGTKYSSGLPDADRPRTARLGRPAVDIAAGANHTCAVLDDKSVKCWGDNRRKQFGITTKLTKSPVPKTVAGLRGAASAIAAGADRTCALLEDTTVKCWGNGTSRAVTVTRRRATMSGTFNDTLTGVASIHMTLLGALTVRDTGGNILCDHVRRCGHVPGAVPVTKEDGESSAPIVWRSAMRGVPLGPVGCIVFQGGLGCRRIVSDSPFSSWTTQGPEISGCFVIDPEYIAPPPMLLAPGRYSSSCDDPSRDYEANKTKFEAFLDPRKTAETRLAQIDSWVSTEVSKLLDAQFRSPFGDVVVDVRDGSGTELSGCVVTGDALQLRCWGKKLQQGSSSPRTFTFAHPEMTDVRDVVVSADRACVVQGGGTAGRFHRGEHRQVLGLEHVPTVRGIRIKDREVADEDRLRRLSEAP